MFDSKSKRLWSLAVVAVLALAVVSFSVVTTASSAPQAQSTAQSQKDEEPPDLEIGSSDEGGDAAPPIADEPDEPDSQPSEPTSQTPATQPATQQAPAEPQPKPSVPATLVAPATQPKPQTPAPQVPKAATTTTAQPSTPPGPPGGDVWIRPPFKCNWLGGPVVCDLHASHSSRCHFDYPGGHEDVPVPRAKDGSDNGEPFQQTLKNFSPKGGDVSVVCYGLEPGHTPDRAVSHVRPAPVSTTTVTVKVKVKKKKHGRQTLRTKTVRVKPPTAPEEVTNSYHGYCGFRSDGTWGFSQAPLKGGAPSLWAPNVGNHCEPEKYGTPRAKWRAYLCAFWHCVDPRKK